MQRLEWHCHSKSVSGALYKAILYHGQSVGKEMANSAVFSFRRNAGSGLDFPDRSWNRIPGTRRSSRKQLSTVSTSPNHYQFLAQKSIACTKLSL